MARILLEAGLLNALASRVRRRLAIVNYHRIRSDEPQAGYPYDDGVIGGPTVSQFRSHLKWLSKHSTVLAEHELIECLESGVWPSGLCTMVTFDDGYCDNHALAFPELARLSVPSTFFIPTGLIDEGRLGWWDLVSYSIKRARGSVELFGRRFELPTDSRDAARHCNALIKADNEYGSAEVVSRVVEITGVSSPPGAVQRRELMSWEQIGELRDAGHSIGSHTVNHPVLSRIAASAQREELLRSRERLQRQLAHQARSIAYPIGGPEHFTSTTQRLVLETGYQLAYSFNTGVNRTSDIRPTDLRRFNGYADTALLAAYCSFPRLVRAPS